MTASLAAAILLGELILLAILSRRLTQSLYMLLLRLFRSKTLAMTILVILLFPGTIVHELAHLFVAEILRVPTGKLTLVPEEFKNQEGVSEVSKRYGKYTGEEEIRTGSVVVAKTDPIRRAAIGVAPVVVGLGALTGLSYFYYENINTINMITIILFYIMFTISNSMFSSKEDMKGVIPVFITLGLFAAAAYAAGLRIGLTGQAEQFVTAILRSLTQSLGLVLAVNGVLLLGIKVLLVLIGKVSGYTGYRGYKGERG